ncbi:MAG: S-methyl-5'-thioinosine phosphorylase [Gammaproteobacteria bacterium]|nr:S-methyl-5'-thioinosine phosphorylase [Gammaproteobacteria bacterium]
MAVAIIGGSGLDALPGIAASERARVDTPYGATSAPVQRGRLGEVEVLFLPRHGSDHAIAPHLINYRANVWALRHCGARCVVAVAAVGGISAPMLPGRLVVPSQVIDYTWGRAHSYRDGVAGPLEHVDFSTPYDPRLRSALLAAATATDVVVIDGGVYGATQGPRLESPAEIERMARDGCDVVGMTGMPEAALACELALPYVCCAVVVNRAAGRGDGPITAAVIAGHLGAGMTDVLRLLREALPTLARVDPAVAGTG